MQKIFSQFFEFFKFIEKVLFNSIEFLSFLKVVQTWGQRTVLSNRKLWIREWNTLNIHLLSDSFRFLVLFGTDIQIFKTNICLIQLMVGFEGNPKELLHFFTWIRNFLFCAKPRTLFLLNNRKLGLKNSNRLTDKRKIQINGNVWE